MQGSTSENLGITGYFGQTLEQGYQAVCMTICSPCMLIVAIILVFYGEYNYVKDLNNIYTINQDMVDGVTSYNAANNGKPVAFYAASVTGSTVSDSAFNVSFSNSIALRRVAYMATLYTTTKTVNNVKNTYCYIRWTTTPGTQGSNAACGGTYNNRDFRAPCAAKSCAATVDGVPTSSGFTFGQQFLINDYIGRTTPAVPQTSEWGNNWGTNSKPASLSSWNNCQSYISTNYRNSDGSALIGSQYCQNGYGASSNLPDNTLVQRYDQSVTYERYPVPAGGMTICSKQVAGGTFEVLKTDGSYDVMINGRQTKADCIKIMEDEAAATVWAFRVIGFILFWVAFCMLFSIVTFLADRVGQLIPCGIGEAFEDMVQCLVAIVTCPPAVACWMFWFGLAWLIFRPLVGGIVFAVSLLIFGGAYYMYSQTSGKDDPEKLEDTAPVQYQQPQAQMQPQQPMNQAAPWSSHQPATVPPPNYDPNDLNNDGIPDHLQNNLPPGWVAAKDPASNRVYWINTYNNTSTWYDPRQAPPPQNGTGFV